MSLPRESAPCVVRHPQPPTRRERGVWLVTLLTAVMMGVEIAVGYATGSMALLADGWHMATHVGALSLSGLAYWFSRRYSAHHAFTFGTGKVQALAGYTNAVVLGLVAVAMLVESVGRLLSPQLIDFSSSLPVAVIGLFVNLGSVYLLHRHDDTPHEASPRDKSRHDDLLVGLDAHDHGHRVHGHHDHNHRAAFVHILADTLTSALAIVALALGGYLHWPWFDPITGVVGALVIVKWGIDLAWHAASELVDMVPSPNLEHDIKQALEAMGGVHVDDVHVWPLGGGSNSCVVCLRAKAPQAPDTYRAELMPFRLAHLTIEVHPD